MTGLRNAGFSDLLPVALLGVGTGEGPDALARKRAAAKG